MPVLWHILPYNASLLRIGDHKHQLGVDRTLAVHPCGCLADADRTVLLGPLTFQRQYIAGQDLTAKAGIFDAAEQGKLAAVLRQA